MLRSNLARPIVRAPVSRRSGMPRGPGGLDEVLLDVTLGTGGVSGSNDPWGWPDDFNAYRVLDWRAGDGITPLVGPTLTRGGLAPVVSKSPFSGKHGAIAAELHAGATQYTATYGICPGAGEDLIISTMFRVADPSLRYVVGGVPAVPERLHLYTQSQVLWAWIKAGGVDTTPQISLAGDGWCVADFLIDRSGNRTGFYANGKPGTFLALPAALPTGLTTLFISYNTAYFVGAYARVQIYRGAGIGALFSCAFSAYRAAAIFGLRPKSKTYYPVFARTGSIITPVGPDVFSVSTNTPRINPTQGLSTQPPLTNKCYKNAGVVAADEAYITVSAGLTKTTQAVTLETYGIYGVSLGVYEVTNATGSDGFITSGATAGSADVRSVSVRGHHHAGAGCELGLYEAAGPTWTSGGAVSDSYARTHALITPGHNDQTWAIQIPDGCTFRFVLQCNTLSTVIAPEILNQATAAAAALGATSVNWGVALPNYKAMVQAEIAPDGWNSGDDLGQRLVLSDATSAGQHMVADDINGEIAISDGTNAASEAIAETDGNYQTVYTGWGPRGIVAEVAATQDRDSYDGAIGAGNAVTGALNRWLRRLRIVKAERM